MTSLKRDQTKIDLKLPQPCLIIATNDEVMQYIRLGANANSGAAQTDIFIADADGKIDPNAPILWDFSKISKVTAYPIDEKTLTVKGGIFTTIANREQGQHQYYSRGLAVRRSNTVLDGIEHRITGESEKSWPYNGFVNIADCAGVTVKNCLLTGHKCYRNINRNGKEVTTGTYDITANRALNITFLNCTQTNDIDDSAYWGLMGTNYCKNIILDGCKFSRFDAHKGVANATIRNSTLGHMGLKAIGAGTLLVENTTVRSGRFIDMRPDYGSTWRGEFIIRNCTFIPAGGKKTAPVIIGGSNSGQHDFGYPCFMPSRIVIDGLTIDDNPPDDCAGPVIFGDFNPKYTGPDYREKFPYAKTQEVVISKLTVKSGTGLRLSNNPAMFRNVKVTGTPVKRD